MIADWWDDLLAERKRDGCSAAETGIYDPPYPNSDDPQDEAENAAYKQGFQQRRKELGEAFKFRGAP